MLFAALRQGEPFGQLVCMPSKRREAVQPSGGFAPVFTAFRTASALARELKRPKSTVESWRARDSIPPEYFTDIAQIARRREREFAAITVTSLRATKGRK